MQDRAEAEQQIAAARGDSASKVIRAIGESEANQLLRISLTPELIEWQKALKWNGVLPQVTGATGTFLNLSTPR